MPTLTKHKKSSAKIKKKELTFIDLFAGIGGFHYAFHELGLDCVFASEIDNNARKSYQKNFSALSPDLFAEDSYLFNRDINALDLKQIPDHDILCGGFPCQPFSIAGYRKGLKDIGRGDLVFNIVEVIEEKKPEVVFLENVKNLYSHDKGQTYTFIKKMIEDQGYFVQERVLNTKDYGDLPQNRERLYIIGFKDEEKARQFVFPDKKPLTKDLLSILENEVSDEYYYNNKPLYEKIKDDITETNTAYQWRRIYVRKNKSGVSPTLTANMGTGGHNVPIVKDAKGIRKLTPLECLRLQGFPSSFSFPDGMSNGQKYKQIGNSVSLPVIKEIAKEIVKVL